MKNNLNKIYLIIRGALIIIPVIFFFFLLEKNLVLRGNFQVEYDFSQKYHPFISSFTPLSRLGERTSGEKGRWQQGIIGEPIYFEISTPRRFKKANLEIEYKDIGLQDFQIGISTDKDNWQYKLTPLENKNMEQIINHWDTMREGDSILLQKLKKFNTIEEFLTNMPNQDQIAVYNYPLEENFSLTNYQSSNERFEFNKPLLGYHQFYTYKKGEPLDFIFNFKRKNKRKEENKREDMVNVFYKNKLVGQKILSDDNLEQEIRLFKNDLPDGVYKIEMKLSDDTIVNKITARQHFFTFINKIHLLGEKTEQNKEGNISLYTNSPSLKFSTSQGNSLQNIQINSDHGQNLKIDDIYKQFEVANYECEKFSYLGHENCLVKVSLTEEEILIQGAGLFSFERERFLNPEFNSLEKNSNFSQINYIIANYKSPEEKNGWKIAQAEFDISNISQDDKKYKFILSIKGLPEKQKMEITRIKAVFKD